MATTPKPLTEHILVFPASRLDDLGHFHGLCFDVARYLDAVLEPGTHRFMRRCDVEGDPSYKQLIPYALLHHRGRFFCYRRGKLMGETRLHQHYSIGIGGHISVDDPNLFGTTYDEGLRREVDEEVHIGCDYSQRPFAVINDDSTPVGRVHFGVAHLFELAQAAVRPKEKSINEARFRTIDELRKLEGKYESWSQFCLDEMDRILASEVPP